MRIIVHPPRGYEFATGEMARCLSQMTGELPSLAAKLAAARGRGPVFVIG